jgi:hypothetical protein
MVRRCVSGGSTFRIPAIFKGPWDAATAVREFKKQFKAKAGTDWMNRVGMMAKKGSA